ncbi:hypothetical protein [Pararhizobium sp. IMCC21322]|uniref:hypothetical protein n=1 Tax=Pararhizobium sp. IMCC21322 TaxID=3067903 RepID=UPI0027425207|nr:hypothetical protein [Pararhizobium sp. IMCC21322]
METTFAVMLLLGCSHDLSQCETIEEVASKYVSVDACERDIENNFRMDSDYPMLMGQCLEAPAGETIATVEIDWQVTEDGNLLAQLVNPNRQYASLDQQSGGTPAGN